MSGPEGFSFDKSLLFVALIALAGALILFLSLPWGIGVSPDSVLYIKAARLLAGDFSLDHFSNKWQPLYPLLLAMFSKIFGEVLLAAKLLQATILALNIFLFSLLVNRLCLPGLPQGAAEVSRKISPVPVFAALFFLLSFPSFFLHQHAVTEGLCIALLIAGFLQLHRLADKQDYLSLFFAALFFSLATLTRYAALVFIFLAPVYYFIQCRKGFGKKHLLQCVLLVGLALLPVISWSLLNQFRLGAATGRELVFHPAGLSHLKALLDTFLLWFPVPYLSGVLLVLLAALWVLALFKQQGVLRARLVAVLVCIVGYIAFIFFSISFMDAYTPVDRRILYPVWMLLFAGFIALTASSWAARPGKLGVLLLSVVMAANAVATYKAIDVSSKQGIGYLTKSASNSGLLKLFHQQRGAKTSLRFYSNAADFVYLMTGQEIEFLPVFYSPVDQQANPDFWRDIGEIIGQVDRGEAVILYFNDFAWRGYYPNPQELVEKLSLGSSYRLDDGYYFDKWLGETSQAGQD